MAWLRKPGVHLGVAQAGGTRQKENVGTQGNRIQTTGGTSYMRGKYGRAAILIVDLVAVAVVCGKGQYVYRNECIDDIQPEIAQPVKPSDEKPPTDKMPSYQREGVTVVDAPNMAFEDSKADAEKRQAEADGKQMAGIKPR